MSQKYNWEKQAKIPTNPINNASSFAQWVFRESRYTVSNPNYEHTNKKKGSEAHLSIDNFFRMQWAHENLGSDSVSDWVIEHTETDGRNGKYYNASSLVINDKPLNCSPDLILRHKEKNRAVIIERKTTEVPPHLIPDNDNGWPNVQAQLWCYSWIDSMLDVEEVTLVGQLWRRVSRNKSLCYMCDNHQMWKRDDKEFHEKSLSWFRLYGGEFINAKK